ncbi:hypothetical protein WBG78_01855 [Chryseolinea sp. T2]|uniref:hypothetical protein n=1 Tax=Chryseolinea sp. T2 TaxID=3129255 RepID=UPI0030775127
MRLMQTMWVFSIIMACLMLGGLYKPWLMLWWRATQTRLDVIKLYGGGAAIGYFVYWLLKIYT